MRLSQRRPRKLANLWVLADHTQDISHGSGSTRPVPAPTIAGQFWMTFGRCWRELLQLCWIKIPHHRFLKTSKQSAILDINFVASGGCRGFLWLTQVFHLQVLRGKFHLYLKSAERSQECIDRGFQVRCRKEPDHLYTFALTHHGSCVLIWWIPPSAVLNACDRDPHPNLHLQVWVRVPRSQPAKETFFRLRHPCPLCSVFLYKW